MSMFEKLSNEDVALFREYINNYGDYSGYVSALPLEKMDYLLRFWESKAPLFHAFGDQMILEKEIMYEKDIEELTEEMDAVRYSDNDMVRNFISVFRSKSREVFPNDFDACWDMGTLVSDTKVMAKNIYEGGTFTIPGEFTKDGRPMTVQPGCKAIKMAGKIAEALGISEGYEEFRQAHSQVLNQKKIKGVLCLSIHPMDYVTMSDNECGWTSCMNWTDDGGDYRLGTIEMMNSPYVVVAYVKAKNDMRICGKTWNNKRWRQLFIVTEDLILGNRQYPYDNDLLQGAAIKWLKDLCEKSADYGRYLDTPIQLRNHHTNLIDGEREVYFDLDTCFMYNDVYDTRLAYINPNINSNYYLTFSGPAVCIGCGEEIEYDSVDSCQVFCRDCGGEWRCECCGDWCRGEAYYDDEGNAYCEWCYHNELERCELCGTPQGSLRSVYVAMPTDEPGQYDSFDGRFGISVCDDCLDSGEVTRLFGETYEGKDHWGWPRRVVLIDNLTDEGLNRMDLFDSDRLFLQQLRETPAFEDRKLLREKRFG